MGTAANWRAMGISPRRLRTLTHSGDLVRLLYGAYATRKAMEWAGDDLRRAHVLRVFAATASVGRDAVASHQSAAVIHGLDLLQHAGDVVTLTLPPQRRWSRAKSGLVVFHGAALPPGHVTRKYGAPVTSVARTVVDLARTLPFMDAVVTADSALRSDEVSKPGLLKVIGECARWPGVQQAGKAIAFADPRAESVLESCGRVVLHESGLEPPELQVTLRGPGYSYTVDFYFARYKTIVEADGLSKYASKEDLARQFRRDRVLRDAGYRVVHFTWRELFETPDVVVERIRKAFASASPF